MLRHRSDDGGSDDGRSAQAPECAAYARGALAYSSSEAGSGHDSDSDGEGMDVMDAFEDFNLRAQKRVQELLQRTEQLLYDPSAPAESVANDAAPELPAHVLMSDSYRLTKPPQLQHWQSAFPYLRVTGSAMLSEPSDEHIHVVSRAAGALALAPSASAHELEPLVISGRRCLATPDDANAGSEEIFAIDGDMEEVLAHGERSECDDSDDELPRDSAGGSQHVSPHASQMSEVVDALTLECFASAFVPLMTSFVQTLFEKHQTTLRVERERVESAARRAVEDRIAAEQAAREFEERQATEAAERAVALARAAEQEARDEAARQELLRQQQREENDDEEIKIRTLAYSHTREWYQPNKKCFSHRGRQLTYLKPVLAAKDDGERGASPLQSRAAVVPHKPARGRPGSHKKQTAKARSAVRARQQQQRPASRSSSPPRSQQRKRASPVTERVVLPRLVNPAAAAAAAENGRTSFSRRIPDEYIDRSDATKRAVRYSRPADVYSSSPFRIATPSSTSSPSRPREDDDDADALTTRCKTRNALR